MEIEEEKKEVIPDQKLIEEPKPNIQIIQFSDFKIHGELGKGSFGTVYLAEKD
jgi:hypothetical protein